MDYYNYITAEYAVILKLEGHHNQIWRIGLNEPQRCEEGLLLESIQLI